MNPDYLKELIKAAVVEAAAINDNSDELDTWLVSYRKILAQRNYAVQTIRNKNTYLKHISCHFGSKKLNSIKPLDISIMLRSFSTHTGDRLLGELKDIYYEAIANGAANNNPVLHLKAPKHTRIRQRLTLEIFNSMLENAFDTEPCWVRNMLLLAFATGQRRGDLVKMSFTDVVDGCLRVEQQKKAGKPIGARLAIPISTEVPIFNCTVENIIEMCKEGTPGHTLLRKSDGDSLSVSTLSCRFHNLLLKVCPDTYKKFEHPSLHEVRSLSARSYLLAGMPRTTVQTLMGHKDEEMTKVYLDDRGLSAETWLIVK